MAEKEEKLKVKLQVLELNSAKSNQIAESRNLQKIKRHIDTLESIVKSIEELRIEVVEEKISNKESIDEVQQWEAEIEAKIDQVDVNVNMLNDAIKEANKHAENERISKQQELLARQREETLQFEKVQLEQRAKFESQSKGQDTSTKDVNKPTVKLPKLVISKFDGKLENWLAFWNKYEAEIDSASLSSVSKFAYLKELVEPNVRKLIDGLPFTTEGYERAKNILKTTFGKTSEIINAYIENITALPTITGSQPNKVHSFYQTLLFNVQSLETLGKTTECWSMVRGVLDKLPGIKADLVRSKPDWQSWSFSQLLSAIREWTEIHPVSTSCPTKSAEKPNIVPPRQRSFQAQEQSAITRQCVYCESDSHKPVDCTAVKSVPERKKILKDKKLCFNCTGSRHRADKCRSRGTCANCKQRHHTSICDKQSSSDSEVKLAMTATHVQDKVCHPVVIVKVNGIKCCALLDTGSTGSYLSSFLVNLLNVKPAETLTRSLKTIVGLVTRRVETYNVEISDTAGECVLKVCATKVDCEKLLTLDNPNYPDIIQKYSYLQDVQMEETATKDELPIHVILGANEYTKIKMAGYQKAGNIGEPVAEKTRFGWTIMTTGAEVDTQSMLLTQTMSNDYEELCRLDVLGLQDVSTGDQQAVYAEFKEQLDRNEEGWYETGLPWKGNHPPLSNNKAGSLKRLEVLTNRLKRNNQLEAYDTIIQEQLKEGIIEEANEPAKGREFYIPHKAVIKEDSETTKMRIVYDASARASNDAPSLNDCLDIGPPLQNQLWEVLVRGRFHAVALAGDIRKAFLQVRIRAEDRDALRFHWIDINNPDIVRSYRFTRALFGLGPSPFLLGGVIEQHLDSQGEELSGTVNEIKRGLYVDDLILGGETIEKTREKKAAATDIFRKASFELHKWHSNARELEVDQSESALELSYAKEQLGTKSGQCKLLGLSWDKDSDTIGVTFPQTTAQPTKREVLSKVAKIFDPLGLAAPTVLQGKLIYRDACLEKRPWDSALPDDLTKRWNKWQHNLPEQVIAPRALVNKEEPIKTIDLHGFGDASGKGVACAVYAVVTQESGVNQGLVAARARLAKQGLTIPRLELVAGHMTVNLLTNVREALTGFPVNTLTGWLDSSVALHWIGGGGEYKQFVNNRVRKINEHSDVNWNHVPSQDNPADLGSRGGLVTKENRLWWDGPDWLSDPESWPPKIVTSPTTESEAEAKPIKQVMAIAIKHHDEIDELLVKSTLWRTLRIAAWISRFLHNTRVKSKQRLKGPLTAEEIETQRLFWIKRVQQQEASSDKFKDDELRLNLKPNIEGVLVCHGRIQGDYPVYLPDTSLYAEKVVEDAHKVTLHGGVGLTMTKVREKFWIPRLRRIVKRVVKRCAGCKRFQAVAFANPPVGPLPTDRTEGNSPFEVIGVDYMGPMTYKSSAKKESKSYVLLYSCSLTRAIHLELLPTLETQDFLASFKRFIARRGRPRKVYSDNGSTFVGAAAWLRKVMHDERLNTYLARHSIQWTFNLSRAPWWGGQFERLVGVVKQALRKSVGRALLTFAELSEVLLDVEVALNGRPLSHVEDDHQLPTLTPNALLYPQCNTLPRLEPHHEEDFDLRKRAKYLESCKQTMWNRWTSEYVRGLRERHNQKHKSKKLTLTKGDVVIIRGDEKDRSYWKLGIVLDLIVGRDGEVRAAKLRAGRGVLERAIQQLYPLELACDDPETTNILRPQQPTMRKQPTRAAKEVAKERIRKDAEADEV